MSIKAFLGRGRGRGLGSIPNVRGVRFTTVQTYCPNDTAVAACKDKTMKRAKAVPNRIAQACITLTPAMVSLKDK